MEDKIELEHQRFKKLLEYFVAHLEWIVNEEEDARGYGQYIKPLIERGTFKLTGQGYADGQIQEQIHEFENYLHGKICINIQPNFGSYLSSKCYLNWLSTGLNIVAKWSGKKIDSLFQEEYVYWEKPTRRKRFGAEKSLINLGLFDGKEKVNNELIDFYQTFDDAIISYNELERKKKMSKQIQSVKNVLLYKKQIILQGPPGTGKTRFAKQLAKSFLIDDLKKSFTQAELLEIIKEKLIINTHTDYNTFEILKIETNGFLVHPNDAKLNYKVAFNDVIECVKEFSANDLVKKYDKKGVGSYIVGIAKYVIDNLSTNQLSIVQFHPSYTYEDFVRGLEAKPNPEGGEGVFYEAVDKRLGKFAKAALDNYEFSQEKNAEDSTVNNFDSFLSYVLNQIDVNEKYVISDKVYIFYADDKRFKYKGDNWTAHANGLNMHYSELQKIISLGLESRQDINKNNSLNALTRQHATYYQNVVELYRKHINTTPIQIKEKTSLKNYVLIIDEINRANLSSVLGELIYALEYRGEAVESMYEIERDGEKSINLVLPPNLYIIGTMNTADRSVGHIDYAIRRRFAFVDLHPEKLEDSDALIFHADLFKRVAGLFISNYDDYLHDKSTPLKKAGYLSPEFEAKDVWLGHSYFIQKKIKETGELEPQDFGIRVKYEIVPILREYVKDGVLNENAVQVIDEIEKVHIS